MSEIKVKGYKQTLKQSDRISDKIIKKRNNKRTSLSTDHMQ